MISPGELQTYYLTHINPNPWAWFRLSIGMAPHLLLTPEIRKLPKVMTNLENQQSWGSNGRFSFHFLISFHGVTEVGSVAKQKHTTRNTTTS